MLLRVSGCASPSLARMLGRASRKSFSAPHEQSWFHKVAYLMKKCKSESHQTGERHNSSFGHTTDLCRGLGSRCLGDGELCHLGEIPSLCRQLFQEAIIPCVLEEGVKCCGAGRGSRCILHLDLEADRDSCTPFCFCYLEIV